MKVSKAVGPFSTAFAAAPLWGGIIFSITEGAKFVRTNSSLSKRNERGFFGTWYDSVKNKVCPIVDVVDD